MWDEYWRLQQKREVWAPPEMVDITSEGCSELLGCLMLRCVNLTAQGAVRGNLMNFNTGEPKEREKALHISAPQSRR